MYWYFLPVVVEMVIPVSTDGSDVDVLVATSTLLDQSDTYLHRSIHLNGPITPMYWGAC